jgi:hypothetical protein
MWRCAVRLAARFRRSLAIATWRRRNGLSPAAVEGAIRLLDQRPSVRNLGDIVQTNAGIENVNG